MRIIDCEQRSEEWERLRCRPTCSEFGSFVTPAKGEYSSQATKYAAKIVAKQLGVWQEPPTSFWMDWGTTHEPNAKHAYTKMTGKEIRDVGFVMPDDTDAYGGSPDGFIGNDGIIEIKCPAPETLIQYHAMGEFPVQYRPQVQGLLMVTGLAYCTFFAFHPELDPFIYTVPRDDAYQAKIADCLLQLLEEITRIENMVGKYRHELVNLDTSQTDVRW